MIRPKHLVFAVIFVVMGYVLAARQRAVPGGAGEPGVGALLGVQAGGS